MPRMRWRHHDLIKPIELNFERKITKARISTNIFPSQFLAPQHARKLQLEGDKHNKWEGRTCAPCPRGDVALGVLHACRRLQLHLRKLVFFWEAFRVLPLLEVY